MLQKCFIRKSGSPYYIHLGTLCGVKISSKAVALGVQSPQLSVCRKIIKIALDQDDRCALIAGAAGQVAQRTDQVSELPWSRAL